MNVLNKASDKGLFKIFVPLTKVDKSFVFEKDVDGKKIKYLHGIASNTKIDKEDERVSKGFIKKMQESALGLTVFAEHEHSIDKTLGYVGESYGDDDNFIVDTALEPEYHPEANPVGNETVTKILNKLSHGTRLGYSIGGRVTKVDKSYDDEAQKEVVELLDGEIYEISVTAMPAGQDTFVQPLLKSMKEVIGERSSQDQNKTVDGDIIQKALTHNSTLADTEPSWGSVDKTKLPRNAHADQGETSKKSTWKYPHHHVKNGTVNADSGIYVSGDMYLHKGGLIAAWAAAQGARSGQQASSSIKSHLTTHRNALGLTEKQMNYISNLFSESKLDDNQIDKIINAYRIVNEFGEDIDQSDIAKMLDELVAIDDVTDQIYDLFWAFKTALHKIVFDDEMEPGTKKDKIQGVAGEFSDKIESLSTRLAELSTAVENAFT